MSKLFSILALALMVASTQSTQANDGSSYASGKTHVKQGHTIKFAVKNRKVVKKRAIGMRTMKVKKSETMAEMMRKNPNMKM